MNSRAVGQMSMDDEVILASGKNVELCTAIIQNRSYHKTMHRQQLAYEEMEAGYIDDEDDEDITMIW